MRIGSGEARFRTAGVVLICVLSGFAVLARIKFLREKSGGGRKRLFVNNLNGPRKATAYLAFNDRAGRTGIFHHLAIDQFPASGFISLEFDPDYARNGKFYTIHVEDRALPASNLPDNKAFPGPNVSGYAHAPISAHSTVEGTLRL